VRLSLITLFVIELFRPVVDSFFHSLKIQAVQRKVYRNELEATAETVSHIHFYNQERLHSALDYQSPLASEKLCA
jgi:transposase InsO family protein